MKKSLLALVLALVCASGVFAFDFIGMGVGMLSDSQTVSTSTTVVVTVTNEEKRNFESYAFSMCGFYGEETGLIYDYSIGYIQKLETVSASGTKKTESLSKADIKLNYDMMFGLGYQIDLDGMGLVLGAGPNLSATAITTPTTYLNGYVVSGGTNIINMMIGLSATANAYFMLTSDLGIKVGSLFTYNFLDLSSSLFESNVEVKSSISIAPNVCIILAM